MVLAFLGVLSACTAPLSGARVLLVLPELPPSAGEVAREAAYRVEWFDAEGALRWLVARPNERGPVVTIPNAPGTAVLAYPLLGSAGGFGRPAGAIFPQDVESGERLVLSWRTGFLAERYNVLAKRGVDLRVINTEKIRRRIDVVAGADPWHVDAVRLENAIAARSLSADSVRSREVFEIELPLEAGVWLRRSMLSPPVVIPAQSVGFAKGYHQLMHADSGEVVAFTVGARGRVSLMTTWPRY